MPSCDGVRQKFINCVLKSDCVLVQRNTVQDCVKTKELNAQLPQECQLVAQSLYACKRGLLDMRKRMRGVPNSGSFNPDED
ncbi:hypothetical protein BB561_001681 [Smittium simulii]|uniref:Uncharacterized protein n=1 Tax=Smittium simulii TaxID=133385 RepID=A0A2T9YTP3_9FUNG|nr:hypothetical protein BB561_001681 [Smittium simulii]